MENKQVGQSQNTANNTGLESLEQAPATSRVAPLSAPKNPQSRPTRPWKKQAMLLAIVLFFVGGLSFAALQLAGKVKNAGQNQDAFDNYKTVNNPVLGNDTLLPVQSLNDQTVTINGDLTVQGKLNLSAQALNDLASILGNTVRLTPALGGPAQAGNINIAGGVMASTFQGNGANLSDLNASSITSGTLNNERLDASVTRLGQTIPLSALQSTVLSSLNGISNNGAASIIGSGSVTVSTDVANGIITIDSIAGDITGVTAGTGLTGGGLNGDVTLNVDTGIVTVQGNTFNGANQLVKLGSAGELPVISATNLTNLNASNISTGTLNDSRLSANVTVQGNSFNGTNQLVKLNGAGELPSLSATNLTNLNASNISTGTLADARLGGNVTLQGNTFNLANKLVQLDSSGNLPSLNGSAITNLNASNISTGTLNDSRLSANVALLNASQTFTGNVVFSQPLSVNVIQPSAAMTIGATNQALTLQGDLTTKLTGTGGTGSVSLGFSGTPVGNVVYQLDASAPAGTYTLCTTVGNCAGSGDGVTSPGGTTNRIAKFVGGQAVGDSSISDDGLLVTVGANALYKAGADSTTAFRVQNAAGSTNVFTVDSTNTRVAIGQSTASYTLDVNGDINSATGLRVGGNLVCDSNGCAASGSSGFYIQNSATTQTAANFNIESTSNSTPTAVLKLKSGQTADLLQARDASNTVLAKIDASGNISTTGQFQVNGTQISSANLTNDTNLAKLNGAQTFSAANLFRNASDSTTAFRIQNAAASNLFVADTSNARIAIGQATAGYTLDVNGDINITNGSSYRINGVAICGPTATCAPSSGSGSYIQNGLTVQTANMNIQSTSNSAVVAVLQGAIGQTADLLQARDSNNNVVAKITSSGAIYQGANQVCDTSNNCGYASNSGGSGAYVQNGTSTQTANMNIKSGSASQVTAVIQGAAAQTADILQVKDGTAQGNTLLSVNQTSPNLVANSSFDTNLTGLTARLSTSSAVNTSERYIGAASAQLGVSANGDGVNFMYPLASTTTYTLSFYIKASAATSMQIGRADDGSTETSCVAFSAITSWQRFSCSFTTGTTSGSPFVYIRTTASSARTLYLDAVQLELGSTATAYQQGQITLNGVINSPTAFRNQSDSTTAILIQNAAGVNQFAFDTVNNYLTNTSGSTTARFGAGAVSVVNAAGVGTQINASGVTADTDLQIKTVNARAFALHVDNPNNVPILNIDTLNVPNLLTNPSYDASPAGTTLLGSSSVSQIGTEKYSGAGSLSVTTTTTNDGAKIAYALASTTTYSFSVYARASGANFSTFQLGYSQDGTTLTSCLTAQTVVTTGWTRYSCTFTTGTVGGAANARYVYVRQTDATGRTFYMDAVQLELASAATNYNLGNISLNGTITSPTTFQNQSNSTTAFQIQNAAGTNMLSVDTINSVTNISGVANVGNISINYANNGSIRMGNNYITTNGWTGGTGGVQYAINPIAYSGTSGSNTGLLFQQTFNPSSGTAKYIGASIEPTINQTGTATGDFTALQIRPTITAATGANQLLIDAGTAANTGQLTLSSSGQFKLKNAVDSNNAFQIQNATGNSVLNINTAVNTASWITTSGLASGRSAAASTTYNGYMYILGGTGASNTQFAKFNSDGTLGSWTATTSLTSLRASATAVAYNGYMYIVGGNNGVTTATVQYAPINGDGTLGAWTTTSSLAVAQASHTSVINNGYIYALGGDSSGQATVQYAPINGDGTLGAWATTTSLTIGRRSGTAWTANGYVYVSAGYSDVGGGFLADVNYAPINGNGTIGTWATTTSQPAALHGEVSAVANGKVYIIGGASTPSTFTSNVIYATLNGNGTIGTWTTLSNINGARHLGAAATYNGYLYVVGGTTNISAYADAQYTSLSAQTFNSSLTFNGLLTNTGPAVFKNGNDSTTAFQIQNAAGTSNLFVADTTNTRLAVAKATASYTLDVGGDINSTTAIRVGGNQVCDSTGCLTSSTSGIKNQTTTQTANMNIQSASTTSPTAVIQGAGAQTANILEVKDGTGQASNIFSVNQTTSNLISNSNFEVDTSGWTTMGGLTLARSSNYSSNGSYSAQLGTTAANDGIRFNVPLAASTTYTMSFYGRILVSSFNNIQFGYSADTTTYTTCAGAQTISGQSNRLTCTFTTGAVSGDPNSRFVYIRQTDATARTFYIDAVQLEAASAATAFQTGQINLGGVVTSQAAFRNAADSTSAFQIQNAAGTNLFRADTVNNTLTAGGALTATNLYSSGGLLANYNGSTSTFAVEGSSLRRTISYNEFLVGGATGFADNDKLFAATPSSVNLLTNGSFETFTQGWTSLTGNTITRVTSPRFTGTAAAQLDNTATAGAGIRYLGASLGTSTTYTFSAYVKASDANFSTLEMGYAADNGVTQTPCATSLTATTNDWKRISCTFTTGTPTGTSGNRYIYIKQTDATARTFYVDAIQYETGSTATQYSAGTVSINGPIISPTVFQNQADSSSAFQIQNASGTALFSADTANTPNLITNPSFDLSTSGWTAAGGATLTRTTADSYSGGSSLLIASSATANDGAVFNYPIAGGATYTFSMYARAISAQWGFLQMYYTNDGSTAANCINNLVAVTGNWIRYTCTFSVIASPTGTRYVGIRQTDATARSFYVDAVQLELGSAATSYSPGSIALNGRINSPVAIQNQSNSTTAFQVQSSAGTSVLNVNTANLSVTVATGLTLSDTGIGKTSSGTLNINTSGSGGNIALSTSNGNGTSITSLTTGGAINILRVGSENSSHISSTSGTSTGITVNPIFQPTSGTGNFIGVNVSPTINQTGTASGDFTALQIRPTVTAATGANQLLIDAGTAANPAQFTLSAAGQAKFQNATNSSSAFQVQNAGGSQILNIDTTSVTNLITNPSFDTNTTGWTAGGSATLSRVTTDQNQGSGALQVNTTATINDGARYPYALAASTTYTFSFYGRGGSGGFAVGMGYSSDGTTLTACTAVGLSSSAWTKRSCTFTTPASVSGSRFVYVQQTDAAARFFMIDTAMLEVSGSASSSNIANISINGAINTPLLLQGSGNSTAAFQVQNTAGTAVLRVDTVNNAVTIGSGAGSTNQGLTVTDAARIQNVIIGGTDGASTIRGATGSGGTINLQNSASQAFAFTSMASTTASNVFQFNATPGTTAENLLQVQRNGTAVATVGNSGSLLLKNTTDSNAAFQIQNATGATALNVNTSITSSTWTATSSFTTARNGHTTVTYNGYMYIAGGGPLNTVQYAAINGDGTVGTWTATSSFTTARTNQTMVANNGYMYILGGWDNSSTYYSDVQYAVINPNGTLGAWTSTSSFTTARRSHTTVVNNGYIYVIGGFNGSRLTDVQYAPLNGNGTVGTWTTTTVLPTGKSQHTSIVANGFVYVMGGFASTNSTEVLYAPLNGNGTVGTWTQTTALGVARYNHATAVYGNKVYLLGGTNTTAAQLSDVMYATLNTNGTVGSWSSTTGLTLPRHSLTAAAYNGYLYAIGGTGSSNYNDVLYTPISSITYANSLTFNGLFNNTGPASFQNINDSTSAFSIQNASASSIFQVDTTNSRVGIGNASPGNLLSVGALTLADGTAQLAVGTGAVGNKGIVIQSVAGQTADFLQAQDSTGAVLAKLDKDGNLTVKSLTITAHIISGGATPTLTNGVDLGTTPGSQTIEGTDTAGRIYFTAGTGPGTNGAMMRVNFATNYTNTPRVVLTPLNPDGSSAGVYLSDISSSGFTIRLRNPVNDTGYDFNYIVIQ